MKGRVQEFLKILWAMKRIIRILLQNAATPLKNKIKSSEIKMRRPYELTLTAYKDSDRVQRRIQLLVKPITRNNE